MAKKMMVKEDKEGYENRKLMMINVTLMGKTSISVLMGEG